MIYVGVKYKQYNGLLDLYNKEKEERKKAEHNYDELTKTIGKLEIEVEEEIERNKIYALEGKNIQLEMYVKTNYIKKDKIREKIKELEEIKRTALTQRTVEMMNDKINALQELLEE